MVGSRLARSRIIFAILLSTHGRAYYIISIGGHLLYHAIEEATIWKAIPGKSIGVLSIGTVCVVLEKDAVQTIGYKFHRVFRGDTIGLVYAEALRPLKD